MKVLVIVDIHKNENALKNTIEYIDELKPDILIIAGDITTFGPLEFADEFLAGVSKIPTLAIPGNCDPREILTVIDQSNVTNLHGRKQTVDNVTFVGLGGSNTTPFNTPFELSEDEIYSALDEIMEPGVILVLHFPVKGHLDIVPRGVHTGSSSALEIVKKYRPSLVISGHIHETRGIETDENGIQYVNPGPMKDGYAAIIDIDPRRNEEGYDCKVQLLP